MGQDATHYLKLLIHLSNSDPHNLYFKYKDDWALPLGMMSKFLSEMKTMGKCSKTRDVVRVRTKFTTLLLESTITLSETNRVIS